MAAKRLDLTGMKFGILTAVSYSHGIHKPSGGYVHYWNCQCECGNTHNASVSNLRHGSVKSCGCQQNPSRPIHGMSNSKEFASWRSMQFRCFNKTCREYARYGGRGITVCERWLGKSGFTNFFSDMGWRPNGTSLDRYPNNNGNYEPGNCRWATPSEQAMNRGTNRFISYNGRTMTVAEWSRELGIGKTTLHYRLTNGWSVENAMTTPVKSSSRE